MGTERATQLDPVIYAFERLRTENGPIVLDQWQDQAMTATKKRMIFLCSRQSGKSEVAADLAIYTADTIEKSLTLLVSPSLRQSSELFHRVKERLRMMVNPPIIERESQLSLETATGSRIIALPGTEDTIVGFAAPSLIVIDEDARVPDPLFNFVTPMMAVAPNCLLLLMSTPKGKRGHFYTIWEHGSTDLWEKIKITADECPRIPREHLEAEQQTMIPELYQQEYYCKFLDLEGTLFSAEDIFAAFDEPIIEEMGLAFKDEEEVQAWDTILLGKKEALKRGRHGHA
jgi:hypothetical protein